MTRYAKLISVWVGAWFVFSLVASGLHLYKTGANAPPIPLGAAALTPIVVFLAWFAASPRLRSFALSLNPRILTMIQSRRLAGFVFLVLAAYGILPRVFALPAGWGDITIGATAALHLASPRRRILFMTWQVLGITDLVMALTLGALAGFIDPRGVPNSPMTVLPLSLIPTFAVPLLLILHIICIAQASRWPTWQSSLSGKPLHSQTASGNA
jgi:hypothetical protein